MTESDPFLFFFLAELHESGPTIDAIITGISERQDMDTGLSEFTDIEN